MSAATAPALCLDSDALRRLLPHRHPFLLLDRVTELEPGRRGVAVKCVSVAEPCFAGHFPERAVFPGVLIVEALAQLAGVVQASAHPDDDGSARGGVPRIGYLASLHGFKFRRAVVPGDRMVLEARANASVGGLTDFAVSATVDGETVATGRLAVAAEQGGER